MITGSTLYCFSIIIQLSGARWSLLQVKTTPPGKQTPVWSQRGLDVMWGAFLIGGIAALWSWCVIVMHQCCWPQKHRRTQSSMNCSTFADSVGGGGCICGKTWICLSDVKTGWVSMIFMRRGWLGRVCAGRSGGGVGSTEEGKRCWKRSGTFAPAQVPLTAMQTWGNQFNEVRLPRALVKS